MGDLLAGGGVLETLDQDLDRVLVGLGGDDVERLGHGLVRLHLLSGVLLGPHDVVDEPLYDAQLRLSEPPVGVFPAGVGDVGGREVHVLGKSAVVDDDVGCVVLAEDQGLLCYDLVCHVNHLTGLSVLPLTIWSRETLLTLMTL